MSPRMEPQEARMQQRNHILKAYIALGALLAAELVLVGCGGGTGSTAKPTGSLPS
jgi:hypothetical protein